MSRYTKYTTQVSNGGRLRADERKRDGHPEGRRRREPGGDDSEVRRDPGRLHDGVDDGVHVPSAEPRRVHCGSRRSARSSRRRRPNTAATATRVVVTATFKERANDNGASDPNPDLFSVSEDTILEPGEDFSQSVAFLGGSTLLETLPGHRGQSSVFRDRRWLLRYPAGSSSPRSKSSAAVTPATSARRASPASGRAFATSAPGIFSASNLANLVTTMDLALLPKGVTEKSLRVHHDAASFTTACGGALLQHAERRPLPARRDRPQGQPGHHRHAGTTTRGTGASVRRRQRLAERVECGARGRRRHHVSLQVVERDCLLERPFGGLLSTRSRRAPRSAPGARRPAWPIPSRRREQLDRARPRARQLRRSAPRRASTRARTERQMACEMTSSAVASSSAMRREAVGLLVAALAGERDGEVGGDRRSQRTSRPARSSRSYSRRSSRLGGGRVAGEQLDRASR